MSEEPHPHAVHPPGMHVERDVLPDGRVLLLFTWDDEPSDDALGPEPAP